MTSVACEEPEPIRTVAAGLSRPEPAGGSATIAFICRPPSRDRSPSTALNSARPSTGAVSAHSPLTLANRISRPGVVTDNASTFSRSTFRTDLSCRSKVVLSKLDSANAGTRKTFF